MTTFFDAFISYGRADSLAFGRKLYARLLEEGFKIWFDQNDIPLGVDFQNQIDDGIEKAHNFLFIIAPHSVNSPYCGKEIELAIKRNKRIIPLLHVEQINQEIWQQRFPNGTTEEWEAYKTQGKHTSFQNMHPAIGKINWVYFREGIDDFEKSFAGLIELFRRHADYVEQHTHFLAKALEWERHQKQTNRLLIGEEKQQAEVWLKIRFKNEQSPCVPTDLHCEYITESIKNANNLMSQVFISYADVDRATMEKIRNSLRRESITVWTNKTDIQTGEAFEEAIKRGIEQADNVVYLVSPDSVKSYFARQELDYALSLNKRIIPVLVRETLSEPIPNALRDLQYIDLTDNVKEDDYLLDESQLLRILRQDEAYYNEHKVLLTKALKWKRQHENPSILLRGYNLRSAETWLKVAHKRRQHPPIALMEEFINESLRQPPAISLDVFISYSRADSDFARKLNDELQLQGKTTWFDQESIASRADFAQEIKQGINACDNFLFILSPRSVNSPYCDEEVEYAAQLNKRFVTVLYREVNSDELHPDLRKVQWIDFNQNERDFNANFRQLVRTLDTDREHLRHHTKWSQRAIDWKEKNHSADLLLRGSELAVAQAWLKETQGHKKQPAATELQKAFIAKSGRYKRKNQLVLIGAVVSVMGIVTTAAITSTALWLKAERQTKIATLQENAARVQNLLAVKPVEALILAIKATGESQSSSHEVREKTFPQVRSSLYDAIADARERNIVQGHEDLVTLVAFSPDGKTIVSGGGDGMIRLWDNSGNPIGQPIKGHENWVSLVAFSPNGKTIVSGGGDGIIRLWDNSGNPIGQPIKGHQVSVTSVAFSPNGKTIVSGDGNGMIRLWDNSANLIGQPIKGHQGLVTSVAFSPNGKTIVSGSGDGMIRLWDTSGNPIGQPIKGHEDWVNSVAFSPDSKIIVSGSADKTIRLWDTSGNPIGQPIKGHQGSVSSVAFSPDGKTLVSGSDDNTIRLWDTSGNPIGQPLKGHENWVSSVAFSPDGKTIVSGDSNGTISPDGKYKYIFDGSGDGMIRLWDTSGNPIAQPIKGHQGSVSSVTFSPDSKIIVSGGGDNTIRLWDTSGNPIGQPIKGHKSWVSSVAFSPNSKIIVSGGGDNTIRLWDTSGNPIGQPIKGHKSWVSSVAFSPNSKIIVSGGADNTIRLWDTSGNPIGQPIKGHESWVSSVAFSPDSKIIVSGGGDGMIRLWDTSGNPIGQPIKGHESWVSSVAFSPDSKIIVSGGGDGMIRLWDTSGNPIGQPIKGHERRVSSVAFSPDGKTIVSGSDDNTIRLWRGGNWQDWLNVACNRLIAHPILVAPETLLGGDRETLDVAEDARKTCQSSVWNKAQNAQFIVNQGSAIAREGNMEGANAKFQQARKLAPNINLPTSAQVVWWAAEGLVNKGEQQVRHGKAQEALAAYNKAQSIDPTWKISADSWNALCWFGTLHGQAAEVMQACEKAVVLAPKDGGFRDSRGIARALTGDKQGAIEDFQAFIKSTDSDEWKKQRQGWIDALKAGKNPFTQEEIEKLKE
jgi:WD40 repeat protein